MLRFVAGDPEVIKGIVARSGAYDHALNAVLGEKKKITDKFGNLPLDDAAVRDIISQAYSPQVLQTNVESLIDGTYHWLDGTAEQPDFSLDVTGPNQALINGIEAYTHARAKKLPTCTLQQSRALQTTPTIDVWQANCLPPGTNIDQLTDQVKAKLQSEKIVSYKHVTADTFKAIDGSQNVFDKAGTAPTLFQTAKNLFWVVLGLCLVVASLIIVFSSPRLRGLERIGKILTITGVLIVIGGVSMYYMKSTVLNEGVLQVGPIGEQITLPLLVELSRAAGRIYLIFGGIVVALGAASWLGARWLLRQAEPTGKTYGR